MYMEPTIDIKRLLAAGKIAIPLKPQPDCSLNPEPNVLVIDNMAWDFCKMPFPDGQGGIVEVESFITICYVTHRELLPEEDGKPEKVQDLLKPDVSNIWLPEVYLPVLKNHQTLIDNIDTVNQVLSYFKFRGKLKGYKLELDPVKSQEYLDTLEAERIAAEEAKAAREAEAAERLAASQTVANEPEEAPE